MKCPLSQGYFDYGSDDKGWCIQDCLKEECAWWSKNFGFCDINILAQELWSIKKELKEIKEKMPHAEQFTS